MRAPLPAAGALFVALAALLLVTSGGDQRAEAQAPPPQAAGEYIVVLRDFLPDLDGEIDRIEGLQGFQARQRFRFALRGFAATLTPGQVRAIERLPWVEFVSRDAEVRAIGSVPLQSGESAPTGTRRIEAATTTTARQASTVNVAVLDTGVDLTHPDLNVVSGKDCREPATDARDDNGHGTHVAGAIGAKNTGSGVVGVAPGTTLYAVKVLGADGSGSWSDVICGIDWVAANVASLNIKVANMSLTGGGSSDTNCGFDNNDALHWAICKAATAGVTFVVAAGNDGANFAGAVPAAYPEVLTVTAMSDSDGRPGGTGGAPSCWTSQVDDRYASYSNYAVASSEMSHAIAGPGTCIRSTWLSGGYTTISGTSMASPHVAGAVALCHGDGGSAGPCAGLAPSQVIQKMRSDAQARTSAGGYGFSGDPGSPVSGRYYGHLVATGAAAASDYTVSASPSSRSVTQGSGTSYAVTVTGIGGYSTSTSLSVSGLPSGATASFSPSSVTPTSAGATSTLNVSTSASTPTGNHTLTIAGTSGALTRTTTVTLSVTSAAAADFTLSVSPSSRTLTRPRFFGTASTTYTVTLAAQGGYSQPVTLSVSGLGSGQSSSFSSNPVTPTASGANSTMRISVTRTAITGTRTLTVTGVGSDGKTKTATVSLTVR